MPPLLDTFPYPWPLREAQELHTTLVSLYPVRNAAVAIAQKAGIEQWELNVEQPVLYLWHDILEEGAKRIANRKLVQLARDQHVQARALLDGLLANQPVATAAKRRNQDGSAQFISGSDAITEKEALLFHDDLSLFVGSLPALVDTLRAMIALAPAVCFLRVLVGNAQSYGTGFRIGPDRVLTNHHVLFPDGAKATKVIAEFGYETDAGGKSLAPTSLDGDVGSIVADEGDDWGVVRVAGMKAEWPTIDLASAVDPVVGDPTYILQHPLGDRKRLAYVRNAVTDFDDRVVHYLTDTEQGSSGAPVFDARGNLVALHHAGGTPQEAAGKAPAIKNEGIRVPRVKAGLAAKAG